MARGWYVVNTYTGYEKKIENIINKLRETDSEFAAYCSAVSVPMEKVVVVNDKGEKKVEEKKVMPGYILVELELPENTWRSVTVKIARIHGVSGFLTADRSGNRAPVPLTQAEHSRILRRTGDMPEEKLFRPKQDFQIGEEVRMIEGPFASFTGTVEDIDHERGSLKVLMHILGGVRSVETNFNQVEKI